MMRRIFQDARLELVLRWILGLTFVYSSLHKIADPAQFAKILYGYALFPDISVNLIAIVLPFVELFSGAALLAGVWPRAAAMIVSGLLAGFIAAVAANLIRGVSFDCGCFSFGQGHTSAEQLLLRDLFYFAAGLQVFFFQGRRRWCLRLLHSFPPSAAASG